MRTAAIILGGILLSIALFNTGPLPCEGLDAAVQKAMSLDGTDTDIERAELLLLICKGELS